MFIPPARTIDPLDVLVAYDILHSANALLENLKTWRKEQYELFWYDDGQPRTEAEVNAILIQMDDASTGQSGRFFGSAVGLVNLILSIEPGSLSDADWHPKYAYTTSELGEIRMIEPEPQ
jgi:hypothetical protein